MTASTSLPTGHRFDSDESVMRYALTLAASARGHVEPNPMVGAVVVDTQRRLIADGHHEQYGGPHAEAHALNRAGDKARGQVLFVTLEPCAHHGKQPPCADAVAASGVSRVVCAMRDPFPDVAGRGFEIVRAAGITVEVGLLEADARRLNAPFLKRVATGRPYVIAKYAMTLDGKMATTSGHSMWISGEASRAQVHDVRGRVDAVIVGSGTVTADNPSLTVRSLTPSPRTPTRVVLDSHADKLTPDHQLAQTATETPTRLYHTSVADNARLRALQTMGVAVVQVASADDGRVDVVSVLDDLGTLGHTNVVVEGGAATLGRFRDAGQIDELHVYIAPKLLGAGLSPLSGPVGGLSTIPERPNAVIESVERLGDDVAVRAFIPGTWFAASS